MCVVRVALGWDFLGFATGDQSLWRAHDGLGPLTQPRRCHKTKHRKRAGNVQILSANV